MLSRRKPLSNLAQVITVDLIGYISVRLENVDKNHEKVGHKKVSPSQDFSFTFGKTCSSLKKKYFMEIINPRRGVRDNFNNTEVQQPLS
jgi:hypothetical protein